MGISIGYAANTDEITVDNDHAALKAAYDPTAAQEAYRKQLIQSGRYAVLLEEMQAEAAEFAKKPFYQRWAVRAGNWWNDLVNI